MLSRGGSIPLGYVLSSGRTLKRGLQRLEAQWPKSNLLFWNLLLCTAYTGRDVTMTMVLAASISLSHVIIRTMWSLQVTVALCWADLLDRTTTSWLTDPSNDVIVISKDFARFCWQMACLLPFLWRTKKSQRHLVVSESFYIPSHFLQKSHSWKHSDTTTGPGSVLTIASW